MCDSGFQSIGHWKPQLMSEQCRVKVRRILHLSLITLCPQKFRFHLSLLWAEENLLRRLKCRVSLRREFYCGFIQLLHSWAAFFFLTCQRRTKNTGGCQITIYYFTARRRWGGENWSVVLKDGAEVDQNSRWGETLRDCLCRLVMNQVLHLPSWSPGTRPSFLLAVQTLTIHPEAQIWVLGWIVRLTGT